jgi:hypothetical protein
MTDEGLSAFNEGFDRSAALPLLDLGDEFSHFFIDRIEVHRHVESTCVELRTIDKTTEKPDRLDLNSGGVEPLSGFTEGLKSLAYFPDRIGSRRFADGDCKTESFKAEGLGLSGEPVDRKRIVMRFPFD